MKIKDSTFFGLLLGFLFIIVILHMSLKNLLKESIFRRATMNNVNVIGQQLVDAKREHAVSPLSDSKQELMDYIKSNIKQINDTQDIRVKAVNYFSPFHQSDIHNQETDLSKYFQIDQPVADAATQYAGASGIAGVCKESRPMNTDNLSGNPVYYEQGGNGDLTLKPDIWTYDNERPMNGGFFDGIRGQDSMQGDFAAYSAPGKSQSCGQGNLLGTPFQNAYPYTQSSGSW